jgi:type IV pilus assembly protein PilX
MAKLLQRQKGFVLAVSMIFLVVMTILAVTAIKKGTTDEKVAGNLRAQNLAFQAAEKALRFCEGQIELRAGNKDICSLKNPATPYFEDTQFPAQWKLKAVWSSATAQTMGGTETITGVVTQPQCLIEKWKFPKESDADDDPHSWVITARGVGNVTEAVVTLKEVIRCGNL